MQVFLIVCLLFYLSALHTLKVRRKSYNVTWDGSDDSREMMELAARVGLRATEHAVRTEDGYVLRMYRVHGNGTKAGPPVLLMHGLLQSSSSWLDAGNASLVGLLAAAGHDLWLGNARGSHFSRQHAWLDPDTDARYWQFSADEIGSLDLPVFIDYILNTTGTNKLNYIGFSQGGSVPFIMCSELPQYCDKINLMISLAPAARVRRTKSFFKIVFQYCEENEEELSKRGIWEVLPHGGLFHSFMETLCNLPEIGFGICEMMKSLYDGPHPRSVTKSTFLLAASDFPAGSSVHNLARYNQHIRSKHFQKFDYGPAHNLILYGNETAPAYNLSAVTVPTVVIYAKNDRLVDASNIRWLRKQLPNVVEAVQVEDPMWSHMDFVMCRDVPKYVYPTVKKYLDKYIIN